MGKLKLLLKLLKKIFANKELILGIFRQIAQAVNDIRMKIAMIVAPTGQWEHPAPPDVTPVSVQEPVPGEPEPVTETPPDIIKNTPSIPDPTLEDRLRYLGVLDNNVRSENTGESDYAQHVIQPWTVWLDYGLNPWDADIIKRVLRKKGTGDDEVRANRITDYEKIIHVCRERLRQMEEEDKMTRYENSYQKGRKRSRVPSGKNKKRPGKSPRSGR